MFDHFIGELKLLSFGWNPVEWVACDGQTLPINQFTSLYSIIGTLYGGNGQTDFAVPDLRGKTPVGNSFGQIPPGLQYAYPLGFDGGSNEQAISSFNMPYHTHDVDYQATIRLQNARTLGTENAPQTGDLPANVRALNPDGSLKYRIQQYVEPASAGTTVNMKGITLAGAPVLGPTGADTPFSPTQPYLGMQWCIAVDGTYPPRN